jgi:hypothetical protein
VTPAASDLGNIPAGMAIWLILGAGAAITVALVGLGTAVIAARRWWRSRLRLRDLTDDGDGQGGVPPLARRLDQAGAPTEAISMRDITAMERLIPACPEFCADLTRPGDGADCTCPAPCGRTWCTRQREQHRGPVPATWTEREEGVR